MNRHWQSILAVISGSFLGALLALEINSRLAIGFALWPLGIIVGGLLSYLISDLPALAEGLRLARRNTGAYFSTRKKRTKIIFQILLYMLSLSFSLATIAFVFFNLLNLCIILPFSYFSKTMPIPESEIFLLSIVITAFVNLMFFSGLNFFFSKEPSPENVLLGIKGFHKKANLLHLVRNLPRLIPNILREIAYSLVVLATLAKKIIVLSFLYIHTRNRVLCLVDSAIGATAGFVLGSPAIGAMAGLAIYEFNRQIVAHRWLRLEIR
ncbi:MAG: hypothetical protein WC473_01200 [Patescibacteria group bacterium]